MSRIAVVVVVVLVVVVLAGGVFLAAFDIPPPTARVERVIPNDRFAE